MIGKTPFALILACTVAFPAGWVQAKTIKMATLAPKGSKYFDIIEDMGLKWRSLSGGKLKLRIYPGGVAGDESDVVRKMRIGQLHAAAITSGGLSDIVPEIRVLQMPMMYRSNAELDYVFDAIAPELNTLFERRNVTVLAWTDAGWIRFFSQEPIVYPRDLEPLKIFTWAGNANYVDTWKALGFRPVPLSATDVHMGLASGLINALPVPPLAALSQQWFGLAKHMTDMRFAPLVAAIVITSRVWRSLPADLKPRLKAEAKIAGDLSRQEVRRLTAESVKVMRKHGLTVHAVPPDAYAEWETRAQAGYPRMVGHAVPAAMFERVKKLRNDFRSRH